MRWICPQCGSEVSLALDACPLCAQAAPPLTGGEPVPAAPVPAAGRAAPPSPPAPTESPYRRGLRIGVGFMLAVVTVVLLVVLLLLWLQSRPEWRERLEQLGG